jgi:hypothetical protein
MAAKSSGRFTQRNYQLTSSIERQAFVARLPSANG